MEGRPVKSGADPIIRFTRIDVSKHEVRRSEWIHMGIDRFRRKNDLNLPNLTIMIDDVDIIRGPIA
jgi:hypothetical protein